ncbi:MAG TPA: hypothetical protein VHD56_18615 [Tepidisphaeraceae bacterium]|nr:hypothetical protein [Tepidisphaeraceae bacterium]
MYGNRLGWTLSILSVFGLFMLISWINATATQAGARTEFSQNISNGAAILLPVSPRVVVPTMTQMTDAGPIYRRAIEDYEKSPVTYDRFARSGQVADVEDVPAIQILLEAANHAQARLFADNPTEIVNFKNEKPALDALKTLGACSRRAGQLIEKSDPASAMRFYEATFSLGDKLYEERLCWAELNAGLTLMAEGSTMIGLLSESTGDQARAVACKRFNDARIEYVNQRLMPILRVITSIEPAMLEQNAGDIIYFARHAEDKLWRVEAIEKLGRYRFNATRMGDQRIAMKVLKELSSDNDLTIKTAAIAARDLTEPEYRMLR